MDSPPKLGQVEGEATPTLRSKAKYTGKVRLCTARYSYNPYDGPNEHPEAELPLVAGKYLYVYGTMDDDGFYEGELLDGQRGLVPSNFVDFVQDKETTSSADGDTDQGYPNHAEGGLQGTEGGQQQDGRADGAPGDPAGGACANGTGAASDAGAAEEEEDGAAGGGGDAVPHPRKITLIKQLAKSVIVAWDPPLVPPGRGPVTGYNVLVDKEVRAGVPAGSRTKALIEKLNLAACTYRVSVQSVAERGVSDELRCSLLVGRNVVVAPYCLRVDDITQDSALVSWLPSNSNYSHTVLLNGAEHREVRPTCYRCRLADLRPMTVYKVTAVAKPHQMPWQLPLEQREKKEMSLEFCTQAAGPPLPPQDVEVQCGHAPGILQVCWSPPALSETGTSNGASVIGYAVCTKGQRIAEVLLPLADFVTVELTRIQCLEAREVVVRTLSVQGESQDSPVAPIPSDLLVPPHPHTLPHPQPHPHTLPHPQSHPHTLPHPQPYSHPQPHPHALPQPHPHTLPHPQPHPQPHPHTLPYPPPHPQPHPHALPHPQPHLQPRPPHPITKSPPPQQPRPPAGAGEPETKEAEPGGRMGQSWDPARSPPSAPPPQHGHALEAPRPPGRRSPSPQRILPQPRGAPIPDTLAKAIARQAAQRVAAESGRERSGFREGNGAGHALHSDEEEEEEEGYDSAHVRRRGASVDEFLRGSELGRQIQYSHSEEYHTESSRGSDLSDIMEEDEEELYSEMQLEEGRRRSMGPHGALKVLGNAHGAGRQVRHGRDSGRGPPQRRPITVPSIEITPESNSEGKPSPPEEDGYYGNLAPHRIGPLLQTGAPECRYDSGREHPSNRYFDESEPEDLCRVFVALFDYDPLSMSPNPDAADEELPFKEGQIIRVYGDKDTDGFYRGEIGSRAGLIPCNMVSEIQAEDEETLDQLLKQGFLSLNTPIDKIDRSRRGTRQPPTATRRMVALYDYDPRESSPNVDVEAELTFCAGDIIAVFGEIDEDGFYYGEINGHRGLIPSNFLEEVPADVEVYLTDTPRQTQDTPSGSETKRMSTEILGTPRRSTSPTACPPQPEAGPGAPGPELAQGPKVSLEPSLPLGTCSPLRAPDSPIRASRDLSSKKKKGLLSKGKNLLKKLAVVK